MLVYKKKLWKSKIDLRGVLSASILSLQALMENINVKKYICFSYFNNFSLSVYLSPVIMS